ncbi:polysaccharide export protein [Thioalkalivibrio sulfidiphilus HL-EbGr7]|uniref:Polysaccharide export protein n=1 Tax=Thioalkalivibrio sulfidiphilus (strain HL-EbGR7) TaxID=396588 RepID=B8GVC4_THISH|nr:XrtA/PEP-CTERM system exopolysaccharide export protein [Thioalkalivibrio sulfidiphilus]ACL73470.1 polysaccharide export protein [Thioalkalivibrio sulfidiphilus HL-EbGr7]
MLKSMYVSKWLRWSGLVLVVMLLGACAAGPDVPLSEAPAAQAEPRYTIGPGDQLNVFVWGNPDLTVTVPVRPDGRITTPLVEDVQASGKTPTELARDIEQSLAHYVQNPIVTVTVTNFVGTSTEQIRVIGQAVQPRSIPYRVGMTVLDVIIEVGGLTEFAAGNRATIIRGPTGAQQAFRVRLSDLVTRGDISANVPMQPGDVLIIPESWF